MSAFKLYREKLVARLATLDGIKTVRPHDGTFNAEDVKAILATAPALHVAVLNVKPATPSSAGGLYCTLQVAVFIVTQDKPKQTRGDQALDISAALMLLLDRWQPTQAGVFKAQPVTGLSFQNLYASAQSGSGQMLSSLTFQAMMSVEAPVDAAMARFLGLNVDGAPLLGDAESGLP